MVVPFASTRAKTKVFHLPGKGFMIDGIKCFQKVHKAGKNCFVGFNII